MMTLKQLAQKNVTVTGLVIYVGFAVAMSMIAGNASAIELIRHESGSAAAQVNVISKQEFEQKWGAADPACLKEGSRMLVKNKAFQDKGLRYADCSNSPKRARIHKAMGIKVNVFKLSELPNDTIKQIKNFVSGTGNAGQ